MLLMSAVEVPVPSNLALSSTSTDDNLLYFPLRWWRVRHQLEQALRVILDAKESPGGDQDLLILNITVSLEVICAFLCIFSAYGMGARRLRALTQVFPGSSTSDPSTSSWEHAKPAGMFHSKFLSTSQ